MAGKIAIASSGLGSISRGIETWARDLAAALHRRGVDVSLFQGSGEPVASYARVLASLPREDRRNRRLAGLIPGGIDWRLSMGPGYPLEQTSFAFSLARVLRRERFDIVHVQDPVVALWLERWRDRGWLTTRAILAHGTEESPEFLSRFRYLQQLSPTHMAVAEAAGVARPTWTTIGNFVDTAVFHSGHAPDVRAELGLPPDAFVLLTLAAIKRVHKRIDCLIDAMALLRERYPALPVYLVIAGGREAETDELIAAGTARLGDRVRFLVRHPRERIPALCRAADVFVLASLFEMMPIALLEAGASGLPCVVNDEATLRWMTGAGGVPTDMADAEAFANTIHSLATDPARCANLGAAARGHVESTFGTDAVVDQVLAYYARVQADDPSRTVPR